MRAIAPIIAVVLASGPARAAAPIIGGTADSGDPAVVLLAAYPPDHSTLFTCSAVVIAPRVLLTAAHCLQHPSNYVYGVYLEADASPYPTLVELLPHLGLVSAVHIHLSYNTSPPFTADIGIVELTDATSITPLPIARTAPTAAMVGMPVHIAGYGQVVYNTYNAKRYAADTVLAAIDSGDTVTVGDATKHTCVGDSGGPAILGGTVIGVDSYSDTTGCTDPSHFRRTDAYLPFIDQYLPAPQSDAGVQPDADVIDTHPNDDSGCRTIPGGKFAGALLAIVFVLTRRRAARYGSGDPSDPDAGSRSRTAARRR